MKIIGKWIATAISQVADCRLPSTKEERIEYLKDFRQSVGKNKTLAGIRNDIKTMVVRFPLP